MRPRLCAVIGATAVLARSSSADVGIWHAWRVKGADAQYLVNIPFDELDSDPIIVGQWIGAGCCGCVLPRRRAQQADPGGAVRTGPGDQHGAALVLGAHPCEVLDDPRVVIDGRGVVTKDEIEVHE